MLLQVGDGGGDENTYTLLVGKQISPGPMKTIMKVPKTFKNRTTVFLDIHLKKPKSSYHSDICIPRFIIAKLWNQSRSPSVDEWIEKMWYIYTREFSSAMMKGEIISLWKNG
jgi:hypothetical protein